jgi:hypothetical protein
MSLQFTVYSSQFAKRSWINVASVASKLQYSLSKISSSIFTNHLSPITIENLRFSIC